MKKVVFLLLISIFLITGCSIKKTEEVTDAEIFASEYAISKDNAFKYAKTDEIIELFKNGTGIVLFGDSDKDISKNIVKLVSNLLKQTDINQIYYYDPMTISDDNTEDYKELIDLLGENLTIAEHGDRYLTIPAIYFVKNGKIIGYNDEAIKILELDDDSLNDFDIYLKEKYLELINDYIKANE